MHLSSWRVPVALLALASIILVPTYFVSAQDVQEESTHTHEGCDHRRPPRGLFHVGEVVEIDTEANTILIQSLRPAEESEEPESVLITYDDQTTFNKDHEDMDEFGIAVGDKIHARGEVNKESEEYFAEIDAEHILLWNELEPKRPAFRYGHRQAEDSAQ